MRKPDKILYKLNPLSRLRATKCREKKLCTAYESRAEGFNVGQYFIITRVYYYQRINTYYLCISGVGTYLRFFEWSARQIWPMTR